MTRLCRTFQTAPAGVPKENTAKYLEYGFTAEGFEVPDWFVPDLEDGTSPSMKATGLENATGLIAEYGPTFGGEIWPRVQWANDDGSLREAGSEEIETLVRECGDHIDGIVVPKVGRLSDVQRAADRLAEAEETYGLDGESIGLSVIVETAQARSDLRKIAAWGADSRLVALVFGPVDYTAELGGREIAGRLPSWSGLLEELSNETSTTGLLSIGGPFDRLFRERAGVTFYNGDGFADQVEREARVGLDGSWSLYPKQTIQANRIHMPTPSELQSAVRSIQQFNEAKSAGTGAVTIDGQMVDEATYKNFANTVETVKSIDQNNSAQTSEIYDGDLLAQALAIDTDV